MIQSFSARDARRLALAIGLCLLAFLFAVEAKLAWYSPSSGPLGAIQSAKARPADAPDEVPYAVSSLPLASAQTALLLAAFATTGLIKAQLCWASRVEPRAQLIFAVIFSSPERFFRPPPAR